MAANKENMVPAAYGVSTVRITRARAAACRANGGLNPLPQKPPLPKPDTKRIQQGKIKRDENSNAAALTQAPQPKKRKALGDITNVLCENSYKDCMNAAKMQSKVSQMVRSGPSKAKVCYRKKAPKLAAVVAAGRALADDNAKIKSAEVIQEVARLESQKMAVLVNTKESFLAPQNAEIIGDGKSVRDTALFEKQKSAEPLGFNFHLKNVNDDDACEDPGGALGLKVIDIDSDITNPQLCCLYSSEIYTNLRALELARRPSSNFMETIQRDITHSMRGVLIDWLVEVSDEYRLVPDTLYLTVYTIDRFLSQNYIERHRLQLLGITSMLIASKYEEICAPRVEEFCFITDNTYSREEVLKMEIQVLSLLGFQLCAPTIKTFLRRFLRAAQASYKDPSVALAHMANYLAELTLVEYSFLQYLPSVIAASAVFLARWTLEQSDHPWNPTLEHYTDYKASELKAAVQAMQKLQMNSNNCPLNAIREKYRQEKFESVASMISPSLRQSLFS